MIWRRRLRWATGVGLLVLIGSSEPGGFGFTVGYTVAFVGVPAWVLTWGSGPATDSCGGAPCCYSS